MTATSISLEQSAFAASAHGIPSVYSIHFAQKDRFIEILSPHHRALTHFFQSALTGQLRKALIYTCYHAKTTAAYSGATQFIPILGAERALQMFKPLFEKYETQRKDLEGQISQVNDYLQINQNIDVSLIKSMIQYFLSIETTCDWDIRAEGTVLSGHFFTWEMIHNTVWETLPHAQITIEELANEPPADPSLFLFTKPQEISAPTEEFRAFALADEEKKQLIQLLKAAEFLEIHADSLTEISHLCLRQILQTSPQMDTLLFGCGKEVVTCNSYTCATEYAADHHGNALSFDLSPKLDPHVIGSFTDTRLLSEIPGNSIQSICDHTYQNTLFDALQGEERTIQFQHYLRILKPGGSIHFYGTPSEAEQTFLEALGFAVKEKQATKKLASLPDFFMRSI